MPDSKLNGDTNLIVMPNIDLVNILYALLKTTANKNLAITPNIFIGCAKPVRILTPSTMVRPITDMTALCVVDAVA